jgi:hypothetical protein
MVEEAVAKKNEILSEAETSVEERRLELQHDLATEQLRLSSARQSTANFVSKLKELYSREMMFLESLSELQAPSPKLPEPDTVAVTAEAIENSVQMMTEAQFREEAGSRTKRKRRKSRNNRTKRKKSKKPKIRKTPRNCRIFRKRPKRSRLQKRPRRGKTRETFRSRSILITFRLGENTRSNNHRVALSDLCAAGTSCPCGA